MFRFLNNLKIVIRQGKKICDLNKQIEELRAELAFQKSLKNQHANSVGKLLSKLNLSNKKLYDIKYILETEKNEYTAYRKIKSIIYGGQANR